MPAYPMRSVKGCLLYASGVTCPSHLPTIPYPILLCPTLLIPHRTSLYRTVPYHTLQLRMSFPHKHLQAILVFECGNMVLTAHVHIPGHARVPGVQVKSIFMFCLTIFYTWHPFPKNKPSLDCQWNEIADSPYYRLLRCWAFHQQFLE